MISITIKKKRKQSSFVSFRILTAREKRVRQKFNSDVELQAYEKRLKDIEKKIRQLVKRGMCISNISTCTFSLSYLRLCSP